MTTRVTRRDVMFASAALAMTHGKLAFGRVTETPFITAVFQSEIYLPDFVSRDQEIAREDGLMMKLITPSSGAQAAQLMVAGAINGWATDPMIILNAYAKTGLLKTLGLCGTFGYTCLVSKSGHWPPANASFAEKVRSLKGKRVGVSGIGAGTDNLLRLSLHEVGMNDGDVTRIGIGQQTAAIGQFLGGTIDAFVSFSTVGNIVIEQQAGATPLFNTLDSDAPSLIKEFPTFGLAVSSQFYAKQKKIADAWVESTTKSYQWIAANRDLAAGILNKEVLAGKDLDMAKRVLAEMFQSGIYKDYDDTFQFSEARFELLVRAAGILGLGSNVSNVKYGEFVAPRARK